jgi:hypothetical protein
MIYFFRSPNPDAPHQVRPVKSRFSTTAIAQATNGVQVAVWSWDFGGGVLELTDRHSVQRGGSRGCLNFAHARFSSSFIQFLSFS